MGRRFLITMHNFVIERVFERGDVDDIRNCRRYYGDEKVREALLNAKFLPLSRIYLASAVIDRPIEALRTFVHVSSAIYFDDAEDSEDPVSLNGLDWNDVKNIIREKVRNYLA
ncbi:MAG: hypothetical protein IPN72_06160 [Saprospiraceae bacterium]|nr:hypothetical protein [Saprospiraceae bacterium]